MPIKVIASSERFEDFLDSNSIYVDKTEYIYNLIRNYKRVFFSRPRRFGKSLTLNTIGTLFEQGVEPYFKGTWIYDKWEQEKYPVLHLNFLEYRVNSVAAFNEKISKAISVFAEKQGLKDAITSCEADSAIIELFNALDDKKIVILIDEYDCQLTANINNPELSVESLSEAMNMSRVHLYKKLLMLTGSTPSEFIRLIRLRRAEQLLRQSQLSVAEISYMVGFNNPRYFSKYFKEMYGMMPSQYKEVKKG